MNKLLLIGAGSVHTYNYYKLIEDYFDDILLLTDEIRNDYSNVKCVKGDFTLKNPIKAFENYRFIKKKIKEFKPDIIHVHQADATTYLALKANLKFNIPIVVTAWGSDILVVAEKGGLYRKMVQYNLQQGKYFTADSEYVATKMKSMAGEKKLNVVVANFGIEPTSADIPKENLIYSNRLHNKLYRIDKAIESFKTFHKNNQDWKLIIAGSGEETGNYKRLVQSLNIEGSVEFKGWLDKKTNNKFYSKSKIFISIPESDATAISLLEAMAAGCIPVVSNLPANREWIEDGKNGIIVEDLDQNFIEQAFKIDYNFAKAYNKKLIQEKASKEVNRKKFIDLYNQIIAEKK